MSRNLPVLVRSLSDAEFDHIVRHGLRPDGKAVAEFVPSDSYQFMTLIDLASILGFIRSQPASGESPPETGYGLYARYQFLIGERKTVRDWFPTQEQALDFPPLWKRRS